MDVILFLPIGGDIDWIEKTSIFTRPGEWPIYGVSLREIIQKEYDVAYLYNDMWLGVPELRSGVSVVERLDIDAIYISELIWGLPSEIYSLIDEVISLDNFVLKYGRMVVGWRGVGNEEIDISSYGLELIDRPWKVITILKNKLSSLLIELVNRFGFEKLENNVYVRGESRISDRAFIDASEGMVVIEDGVVIEPFTYIKGPAYISRGSKLLGGKLSNCIIGPTSKIGCEVDTSIIFGYSNAAHHGYIGHSAIGYWVNIGAGTVFSDLKNTYGMVRQWLSKDKREETGMIKLGSYIGDHVKTGVLTSIYGGSLIGWSSHVLHHASGYVPPLTILDGLRGETIDIKIEKAIEIAKRMYGRRGVRWLEMETQLWRRRAHQS